MKVISRTSATTEKHGRIAVARYSWNNSIYDTVVKVTGKQNEKTQPVYWDECKKQMLRRIEADTQMLKNAGLDLEYVI